MPTIIDQHIEAAGHSDDELFRRFIRQSTPFFVTRHIVNPMHTMDGERNLVLVLKETQVSSLIKELR